MKILAVVVEELPTSCMGESENNRYYPNPCIAVCAGTYHWCMFTEESIDENNDPFKSRPSWCPLTTHYMASLIRGEGGDV